MVATMHQKNLLDDVETMFKRLVGRKILIVTARRNGYFETDYDKVVRINKSAKRIHVLTEMTTYVDIEPELVHALPSNLMIPSSNIHIDALLSPLDVMPRGIMVGYNQDIKIDGMVMYRLFLAA